jgi:hypothetical protein
MSSFDFPASFDGLVFLLLAVSPPGALCVLASRLLKAASHRAAHGIKTHEPRVAFHGKRGDSLCIGQALAPLDAHTPDRLYGL